MSFMTLGVVGLIMLSIGLNLHGHDFGCADVSVPSNLRAWCAHSSDMESLDLALFVNGVVIAFLGPVAACAVLKVGTPRRKSVASQSPAADILWKSM
jgi:hypothetical protein